MLSEYAEEKLEQLLGKILHLKRGCWCNYADGYGRPACDNCQLIIEIKLLGKEIDEN